MWLYIPLMGTDLKLGKGHNCRSQMGDIPLLCLMRRSLQQPLAERLSRPETRRKLAAACCNTYINVAAQNDRKVFPEGYGLYLIRISRFPRFSIHVGRCINDIQLATVFLQMEHAQS